MAFENNLGDGLISVTVDTDAVVEELRSLRSDMTDLSDRMARLQVVMDTGTLVGELADPIDFALGRRMAYKGRGN